MCISTFTLKKNFTLFTEVLGTARSVNCVVRLCSKDSSGDDESTPLLKKPPQVSPPFHYRGMVVRVFCLSLFLLVGVTIGLYLLNKECKINSIN